MSDARISTEGIKLWAPVPWNRMQYAYHHTKAQYTALVEDALAGKDVVLVNYDVDTDKWGVVELPAGELGRGRGRGRGGDLYRWQPAREFLIACDAVTRVPEKVDLVAVSELVFKARRARHHNPEYVREPTVRDLFSGTDLLIAAGMLDYVRDTWLDRGRALSAQAWEYDRMYSPPWSDEAMIPTFAVLAAGAATWRAWIEPPSPPLIAIRRGPDDKHPYRIAAQHAAQALAAKLGWPPPRMPDPAYVHDALPVAQHDPALVERLAAWGDGPLGQIQNGPHDPLIRRRVRKTTR